MSILTQYQILVDSPFSIIALTSLDVVQRENEHARATFTGVLEDETGFNSIQQQLEGKLVRFVDQQDGTPIFTGYLQTAEVGEQCGYFTLSAMALSGSIYLDQIKCSRSYQDVTLLYTDVIRMALCDVVDADFIMRVKDKPIGTPIVQYSETGWDFAKRIASHFGTTITPDMDSGLPRFWMGLRSPVGEPYDFSDCEYRAVIEGKYYDVGGSQRGFSRAQFLNYVVKDFKNRCLGSRAHFRGQELFVCRKSCSIGEDGLPIYFYTLGYPELLDHQKYYNENISGLTLLGKVIATQGGTVKLHLNIDESQDIATAYNYRWAPPTGNYMYLMPKIGSEASLYFSSSAEDSAKVINCVRAAPSTAAPGFADPSKRGLSSEHGKNMLLYPDKVGFESATSDGPLQFMFNDNDGVTLETAHSITVVAQDSITLEAPEIEMTSPTQVSLNYTAGQDITATTNPPTNVTAYQGGVMCVSENGRAVNVGNDFRIYPPYDDKPEEGQFDWGGLFFNILAAVAVVVCVAVAVATVGLAVPVLIAGGMAIAGMVVRDIRRGNVSSTNDYLQKSFVGSIVGMVTGGFGAVASGLLNLWKSVLQPTFADITKDGRYQELFELGGFLRTQDANGVDIYHAKQDCLQQIGGYNDLYDAIFNFATSMDREKFQFSSGGEDYIIWAWKGDYLNLGAGAEMGIYRKSSLLPGQWDVDQSLAMHMTLQLQQNGRTIIDWDPQKDENFPSNEVWWVTGFNPYVQDSNANSLTAIYTITFNDETMYNDFIRSLDSEGDKKGTWSIIDPENYTVQYVFGDAAPQSLIEQQQDYLDGPMGSQYNPGICDDGTGSGSSGGSDRDGGSDGDSGVGGDGGGPNDIAPVPWREREGGQLPYLVRGAYLRCKWGSHTRRLNLPRSHGYYIGDHPLMNAFDNVPGEGFGNIPPFGVCQSPTAPKSSATILLKSETSDPVTGMPYPGNIETNIKGPPCIPAIIGPWQNTHQYTLIGTADETPREALTMGSFLVCALCGMIEPQNSGQPELDRSMLESYYNSLSTEDLLTVDAESLSPEQQELYREQLEKRIKELEEVANEACAKGGDPINLSTGNFICFKEDIEVPGRFPLVFKRFYNAVDLTNGVLGENWTHNFNVHLEEMDSIVRISFEDSHVEFFQKLDDEHYASSQGYDNSLLKTNEGYSLTFSSMECYLFDDTGNLQAIIDTNGNRTELSYTDGVLGFVRNPGGCLSFVYDTQNRIIEVSDHIGRHATLEYADNHLVRVTHPSGATFGYEYNALGRISKIINPLGVTAIQNEYDTKYRTVRQRYANGGLYTTSYHDQQLTTSVTEQNGNKISYIRDEKFRTVRMVYSDSEERFEYNDQNKRTLHSDRKRNIRKYEYDARGNIIKITDPLGNATLIVYDANNKPVSIYRPDNSVIAFEYDTNGNMITRTDPLGFQWHFLYDDRGFVTKQTLPDGSIKSFTYDERGNILTVTDSSGNVAVYEYDKLNRVVKLTNPEGHATCYSYYNSGDIAKVTNAEGGVREYEYNDSGKLTKVIDFNGGAMEYVYNTMGKLEEITNQNGRKTRFTYDLMGNPIGVKDPMGYMVRYQYDKQGCMIKSIDQDGNVTQYKHDPNGNVTAIVSPVGARTEIVYDPLDRKQEIREADGAVTQFAYDACGNLTKIIDPQMGVTTRCYDQADRLSAVSDPMGNTTYYTYNSLGLPETVTDPAGGKQVFSYYPGGQLASYTRPDGSKERYEYNKNGNVIKITDGLGNATALTYDCMDRVELITNPLGGTKRFAYDALGSITSFTDENGNTKKYSYSPTGELIEVTDALGNSVRYGYDATGQLTRMEQYRLLDDTFANLKEREFQENTWKRGRRGEIVEECSAFGDVKSYKYDAMGNLVSITDYDGIETLYEYDSVNNLTKIAYADGKSVEMSYDPLRKLTELRDWLGTTSIARDKFGRVQSVTDFEGRAVEYKWDVLGRRQEVAYQDQFRVGYEWSAAGRLESVTSQSGVTHYRYDQSGRLIEKLMPGDLATKYELDPMGRLANLTHSQGGQVLDSYRYEYDPVGNITGIEKHRTGLKADSGYFRYTYDPLGRLTEISTEQDDKQFIYDSLGNRVMSLHNGVAARYSFNARNQLIYSQEGDSKREYSYDHRGNLTQVTENGLVKESYVFDATNRMTQAITTEGCVAYMYNGFLKRVKCLEDMHGTQSMTVNAQPVPARETHYILDATRPYNDLLATEGAHTMRFVWANTLLASEGTNSFIYLQDHLGTPIRLKGGKQDTALAYDEFGVPTVEASAETHNPFGFTGYQMERASGLYYAQARYYNPDSARFISEDFVHNGINYYVHCYNNPLRFVDVNGLWGEDVHYGSTSPDAEYGTYKWAQDLGLSESTSRDIAASNQGTDSILGGKSFLPIVGDQSYHFNRNTSGPDSRQVHADQNLASAISVGGSSSSAHQDLGQGLHALQDIQAHGNYGVGNPIAEHIMPGNGAIVDDPKYDWTDGHRNSVSPTVDGENGIRILRTELATKDYLTKFILETCV